MGLDWGGRISPRSIKGAKEKKKLCWRGVWKRRGWGCKKRKCAITRQTKERSKVLVHSKGKKIRGGGGGAKNTETFGNGHPKVTSGLSGGGRGGGWRPTHKKGGIQKRNTSPYITPLINVRKKRGRGDDPLG